MTERDRAADERQDRTDVLEEEPQSKRGTQGQAVHGGETAGPNSSRSGETIAPQKGDPARNQD